MREFISTTHNIHAVRMAPVNANRMKELAT
jgi:hypothetical protein